MRHIGQNVARLRGFRQIPQKEMAIKLQMAQQTYSALESKAEIDEDLLDRIAAALDFPVEALKELDAYSVININDSGDNIGNVFHNHSSNEEMRMLYEKLLKEKDELLKQKDEIIEMYKQQQKNP